MNHDVSQILDLGCFADFSGFFTNLLELIWRLVVHRMIVDIVKLHLPVTEGNSSDNDLLSTVLLFFSFC